LVAGAFPPRGRLQERLHEPGQSAGGEWAGTTFKQCNKGAHDGFEGDLLDLVKRSGNLIDRLRDVR
jgi:hypothetical protein